MSSPRPHHKLSLHLNTTIVFFANQKVMEIHVGHDSLPIWFALTADIQRFLTSRSVAAILKQQPLTASRWLTAQAIFERIAATSGPVTITIEEADAGADLLACLYLACKQPAFSNPWKQTFLEIWAKVARYQFEPLPKVAVREKAGVALNCYDRIRKQIKSHSLWLTLEEVHRYFLILKKYQGKDPNVLALKDRLDAISRMYRLALNAIEPAK